MPSNAASKNPPSSRRTYSQPTNPAPPSQPPPQEAINLEPAPAAPPDKVCQKCRLPNIRKRYLQCDGCKLWSHLSCVGLTFAQSKALPRWLCDSCLPTATADSDSSEDRTTDGIDANLLSEDVFTTEFPKCLATLKLTHKVIPRIPRGAREDTSRCLAQLIDDALGSLDNPRPWAKLLCFPYGALSVSLREEDGPSLTSKIRAAARAYSECSDLSSLLNPTRNSTGDSSERQANANNMNGLKNLVNRKLADMDVKGAIRVLSSTDDVADDDDDTRQDLELKHPPAPDDLSLPARPPTTERPYTEAEVMEAIRSFPRGSSAGLDGLRPAHLVDLVGPRVGEAGAQLRRALTRLVNTALRADLPNFLVRSVFGASLCALRKKTGGLRPIAVGCLYRRLATKVGLRPLTNKLGAELAPIQLGFGSRNGCEAAVHATRFFLETMPIDFIIVKIDMRNAFNSVRRDHVLNVVGSRAPSLLPLLHQAYSRPTPLYFRGTEISSCTGVQQGDPAGPAIFALAVDDIARSAKSPLNVWYLDDATIGGPVRQVFEDLKAIIPRLEDIGLFVNTGKCEVITSRLGSPDLSLILGILPNVQIVRHDSASLLGSPLTAESAESLLSDREVSLHTMIDRLHHIEPHHAFFLLKNSLWVPKLLYTLRTSPCHRTSLPSLERIDEYLKEALSSLTNISFNESSWAQAVLPVGSGGLGLRRLTELALPAYIASLHSSSLLVKRILPSDLHFDVDLRSGLAIKDRTTKHPALAEPPPPLRSSQKAWDTLAYTLHYDDLLLNSDQLSRARLLAAASPGSGAWLQAIPLTAYDILLDAETLRIGIGR